jgi:hypothetical protein
MPRALKRSPLVCEYLENISRDALAEHQNVIRSYVVAKVSMRCTAKTSSTTLGWPRICEGD